MPGLLTWPATHSRRGPPFFGVPRLVQVWRPSGVMGVWARIATLAFERFHQRGLLAAFIGACASVSDYIEVKTRAENVLAEITVSVGFGDGGFHDVERSEE